MQNRLFHHCVFLFIFLLLTGCSDDDDPPLKNRDTNADAALLIGTWAIFQGELEGEVVDIPENNPECGRDFFIYNGNGTYTEYLITDNFECVPDINVLQWSLENGILTLNNAFGQSETLTVVELTSNRFVFSAEIDFDEDGTLELFTFTARPYSPPADVDNYSFTFNRDFVSSELDKIRLSWRAYQGFNTFDRYEIYRASNSCNKSDAQLIQTITTQETDFFIDEDPEPIEELCYFFRLYTDQGQLSESELVSVLTDDIEVPLVDLQPPVVSADQIDLTWSAYQGFYFSHYEIVVRNYLGGSGAGFQEEVITEIEDVNLTSFTDSDPPFVSNPVYAIRAVNIFGNRNGSALAGAGAQEISFNRTGLISMEFIRLLAVDPEETALYFFGNLSESNLQNITKFNYVTNSFILSDTPPNTSSEGFMKVIISPSGKELMLSVGSEIRVYDALTMNYKYTLRTQNFLSINDFDHVGNDIWVITDDENLYAFSRSNDVLTQISAIQLSSNTVNSGRFQLLKLENNNILVGHEFSTDSFTFTIDSNGDISDTGGANTVTWKNFEKTLFFNPNADIILSTTNRNLLNANDFTLLGSFDRPFLPIGLTNDGSTVLGTDNDPDWPIDENSQHQRKAVFYDILSNSVVEQQLKGYPHFIYENPLGQRVSISSWFKRENLKRSSARPDLFVEILE